MSAFIEAFEQFQKKSTAKKIHTVIIQDKTIEVDLVKKLEIMRAGEDKYMLQGNNIVLKPTPKTNRTFPELRTDKNGYDFYNHNPYWVQGIIEEGYTWQTPSE